MNIQDAMAYIHKTSWLGSRPGLSRIRELCALLGNPQERLRVLHVAGTNGKGSTSAMLDSILRAAGYRVALFTSPYLYRFAERMRVDGVPISDGVLCRLIERVRPLADGMQDPPTEFELITAAAFLWFAEEGVDFAVIEVGMGGRLDATNILDAPLLSLITGISLDHTVVLGDTVEQIAKEKAGILRPRVPLVCGEVLPSVRQVLTEEAERVGTVAEFVDAAAIRDVRPSPHGTLFSYRARQDVFLPFAALYQPKNAALVLDACDALRALGVPLSEDAVRQGLAATRWQGRFEYFSHEPDVIFDGSHNPEGIAAARESIRALYGGKILLLTGVMRDKDYSSMIGTLAPLTERVFAVTPDNPRALSAEELAAAWQASLTPATAYPEVTGAMRDALAEARRLGLPLFILGSLYLYREAHDAYFALAREGTE